MRTAFNIELLTKIYNNPFDFIGQRNLNLLFCFIPSFGEFDYEILVDDIKEFNDMPNFRSFIEKKTKIELTPSLHWKYALGFNVEDQRESYELFFQLLFDYENSYALDYANIKPIKDYDIDFDKKFSPIESMNVILKRNQMFEIYGISSLRAFIDGYIFRMEESNMNFSDTEMKIVNVIKKFKSLKNPYNKFETWDRIILKEKMNISEFTNSTHAGTWAMKRFIEILEQEAKIKFETNDE